MIYVRRFGLTFTASEEPLSFSEKPVYIRNLSFKTNCDAVVFIRSKLSQDIKQQVLDKLAGREPHYYHKINVIPDLIENFTIESSCEAQAEMYVQFLHKLIAPRREYCLQCWAEVSDYE